MIIGIVGKAGSGKDLLARMLQWHSLPESVYSKTFGDFEADWDFGGFYSCDVSKWKIKRFAEPVYSVADTIVGKGNATMFPRVFKERLLPILPDNPEGKTGRDLLQAIGHGLREAIHPDIWVNILMRQYNPTTLVSVDTANIPEGKTIDDYTTIDALLTIGTPTMVESQWIITDVRYPNEVEAIRAKGGRVIQIVRDDVESMSHPSENSLNGVTFDTVVENNGSIEQLFNKAKEIL